MDERKGLTGKLTEQKEMMEGKRETARGTGAGAGATAHQVTEVGQYQRLP